MSLPVSEMVRKGSMTNIDCILCGECADGCAGKALSFGFGISRPVKAQKIYEVKPEKGQDI